MSGEQLGRRSLIIDAGYCAVAGSVAIAARRPLARSLGIGPRVVAGAGLPPARGTHRRDDERLPGTDQTAQNDGSQRATNHRLSARDPAFCVAMQSLPEGTPDR